MGPADRTNLPLTRARLKRGVRPLRGPHFTLVAVPLLLLVLTVFAQEASSCVCGQSLSQQESFSQADFVVLATTTDIDRHRLRFFVRGILNAWARVRGKPEGDIDWVDSLVTVTFETRSVWKGPSTDSFFVLTGRGGGDCGFPFDVGESYLLYLSVTPQGFLYTDICCRVIPEAYVPSELAILGEPLPSASPEPDLQ